MRDVGRVVLCGCAAVEQQVLGLMGIGDCAVGPDQGAGEHEGCGEGGAVCPCSCWLAGSWVTGFWRQCCWA